MDQMNSTITNPLRQIKEKSRIVSKLTSIINNIGFAKDKEFTLSDHVFYLLKASENSDQRAKSRIENHLVKMGEDAVPFLIQSLIEAKGSARGLAAMALIRIGTPSINYLKQVASDNPELSWVSEYIIREIKGTEIELSGNSVINQKIEDMMVG